MVADRDCSVAVAVTVKLQPLGAVPVPASAVTVRVGLVVDALLLQLLAQLTVYSGVDV